MRSTLSDRPRDNRGFIIPWFVTNKKPDGRWDFVRISPSQVLRAVEEDACWICGGKLTPFRTFAAGPLSVMTCCVAEPPGHLDCMRYAVVTCPFMTTPTYQRSFVSGEMPGFAIPRNPKVSVLASTNRVRVAVRDGGILFHLSGIFKAEFYREGRKATEEELAESIEEGLPMLLPLVKSKKDLVSLVHMACNVWTLFLGHAHPEYDKLRKKYLGLLTNGTGRHARPASASQS